MSRLIAAARNLRDGVGELEFGPPVTHVYNPLDYAWEPHRTYLERFGGATGRTVLVGMNPGPFGMVQTGVPFGDVEMVRDWMGIDDVVRRPERQHPRRPVLGFQCPRREASGSRLWGWARQRFGSCEELFARFFVLNYCPLAFLEESGRNRTPDKLPAGERGPLFEICDRALRRSCDALAPARIVAIGRFAEGRCKAALADLDLPLARILHPSPASPLANSAWAEEVEKVLDEIGAL